MEGDMTDCRVIVFRNWVFDACCLRRIEMRERFVKFNTINDNNLFIFPHIRNDN